MTGEIRREVGTWEQRHHEDKIAQECNEGREPRAQGRVSAADDGKEACGAAGGSGSLTVHFVVGCFGLLRQPSPFQAQIPSWSTCLHCQGVKIAGMCHQLPY